jgi:cobalt/nickel transport system permease protein
MHIPGHMINTPVAISASVASCVGAGAVLRQRAQLPGLARMALVAALVFCLQMLNFPVSGGTSGHVIGAALAVLLLGLPGAVLVMIAVLSLQALVFGDGGLAALGANILSMGIVAPMVFDVFRRRASGAVGAFVGSFLSVMAAQLVCALAVALSGMAAATAIVPAMTGAHVAVALVEGGLAAMAYFALRGQAREARVVMALGIIAGIAALISPLASALPDGLESVAVRLGFPEGADSYAAPFADYMLSATDSVIVSIGIAIAGACFAGACAAGGLVLVRSAQRR